MRHWQWLFVTVDAIGLIAFTVICCDVAATLNVSPAIVVLAGAITGVCGGMLCNQMPLVLYKEPYAGIALGAGALYVALQASGVRDGAGRRLRGAHAGRALPLAAQDVVRRRFGRRKLIEFITCMQ